VGAPKQKQEERKAIVKNNKPTPTKKMPYDEVLRIALKKRPYNGEAV